MSTFKLNPLCFLTVVFLCFCCPFLGAIENKPLLKSSMEFSLQELRYPYINPYDSFAMRPKIRIGLELSAVGYYGESYDNDYIFFTESTDRFSTLGGVDIGLQLPLWLNQALEFQYQSLMIQEVEVLSSDVYLDDDSRQHEYWGHRLMLDYLIISENLRNVKPYWGFGYEYVFLEDSYFFNEIHGPRIRFGTEFYGRNSRNFIALDWSYTLYWIESPFNKFEFGEDAYGESGGNWGALSIAYGVCLR